MTDPPSDSDLAEALSAAGLAHHEYEQTALKGVRDELWAGFYAAFVLGRLGDFTAASMLAALLEEVDAPSIWSEAAAEYVATGCARNRGAMAPTVTDVSDRSRFEIEIDGGDRSGRDRHQKDANPPERPSQAVEKRRWQEGQRRRGGRG